MLDPFAAAAAVRPAEPASVPTVHCANRCRGKACRCVEGQPCCVARDGDQAGKCCMATIISRGGFHPVEARPAALPIDPGPSSPRADSVDAPRPEARASQIANPPPPAPSEWRVDLADPRYELYGRVEASGWFIYTARRPRYYVAPAAPYAAPSCTSGRCPRPR